MPRLQSSSIIRTGYGIWNMLLTCHGSRPWFGHSSGGGEPQIQVWDTERALMRHPRVWSALGRIAQILSVFTFLLGVSYCIFVAFVARWFARSCKGRLDQFNSLRRRRGRPPSVPGTGRSCPTYRLPKMERRQWLRSDAAGLPSGTCRADASERCAEPLSLLGTEPTSTIRSTTSVWNIRPRVPNHHLMSLRMTMLETKALAPASCTSPSWEGR